MCTMVGDKPEPSDNRDGSPDNGFPVAEPAVEVKAETTEQPAPERQRYGGGQRSPGFVEGGQAQPSPEALALYENELRNLRLEVRACEEKAKQLADLRGPDGAELTLAWRRLQEARHRIGEALVLNNFAESFSN